MTDYTDTIRRWATDSRRAGPLRQADGIGEVGLTAAEIGHRLAVRFALKVELERIVDARYEVFGCGFSMAACAVAADMVIGHRLQEVISIDALKLDKALAGLPVDRRYCADLAIEALHAAARSAMGNQQPATTSISAAAAHGPRITTDHPVYQMLSGTPQPDRIAKEDRHLFACLLSVASEEPCETAAALGLQESDLEAILAYGFPGVTRLKLDQYAPAPTAPPAQPNADVLNILLAHVPTEPFVPCLGMATWLARSLATRAALPGHLWVAMGLTERPQLTAAIRRHLPSLAAANSQNMRWKRYLYKQVCERQGGTMCKAPNCGVCSDYALCFADD